MLEKLIESNILPNVIKDRISELNELVEKYPVKIPTDKVAKFLKMDIEVFRRAIEQGKLPFAIGCSNGVHGNRYAYISTTTFYLWLMAPILK